MHHRSDHCDANYGKSFQIRADDTAVVGDSGRAAQWQCCNTVTAAAQPSCSCFVPFQKHCWIHSWVVTSPQASGQWDSGHFPLRECCSCCICPHQLLHLKVPGCSGATKRATTTHCEYLCLVKRLLNSNCYKCLNPHRPVTDLVCETSKVVMLPNMTKLLVL